MDPLLSSSVCKLFKVNKWSFLSLEPSNQSKTVALRLHWIKNEKEIKNVLRLYDLGYLTKLGKDLYFQARFRSFCC